MWYVTGKFVGGCKWISHAHFETKEEADLYLSEIEASAVTPSRDVKAEWIDEAAQEQS